MSDDTDKRVRQAAAEHRYGTHEGDLPTFVLEWIENGSELGGHQILTTLPAVATLLKEHRDEAAREAWAEAGDYVSDELDFGAANPFDEKERIVAGLRARAGRTGR